MIAFQEQCLGKVSARTLLCQCITLEKAEDRVADQLVKSAHNLPRAAEDTEFDRLRNEATQKVLDTLADMPDAISMLLAAKSARVSFVAYPSRAGHCFPSYCVLKRSTS